MRPHCGGLLVQRAALRRQVVSATAMPSAPIPMRPSSGNWLAVLGSLRADAPGAAEADWPGGAAADLELDVPDGADAEEGAEAPAEGAAELPALRARVACTSRSVTTRGGLDVMIVALSMSPVWKSESWAGFPSLTI